MLRGLAEYHTVGVSLRVCPRFFVFVRLLCGAKAVGHKVTTISDIMPMVGARFYGHIENMQLKIDYLEDELSKVVLTCVVNARFALLGGV